MKNFKFYMSSILFSTLFFLPTSHLSAFGDHGNSGGQSHANEWQDQSENRQNYRGQNRDNRGQDRENHGQDRSLIARGERMDEHQVNRDVNRYGNDHRDYGNDYYHHNWNESGAYNSGGTVINAPQPVVVPANPQGQNPNPLNGPQY